MVNEMLTAIRLAKKLTKYFPESLMELIVEYISRGDEEILVYSGTDTIDAGIDAFLKHDSGKKACEIVRVVWDTYAITQKRDEYKHSRIVLSLYQEILDIDDGMVAANMVYEESDSYVIPSFLELLSRYSDHCFNRLYVFYTDSNISTVVESYDREKVSKYLRERITVEPTPETEKHPPRANLHGIWHFMHSIERADQMLLYADIPELELG